MPSSTFRRKSSRVRIRSTSDSASVGGGMWSGRTSCRNRRSLSLPWTLFLVYQKSAKRLREARVSPAHACQLYFRKSCSPTSRHRGIFCQYGMPLDARAGGSGTCVVLLLDEHSSCRLESLIAAAGDAADTCRSDGRENRVARHSIAVLLR